MSRRPRQRKTRTTIDLTAVEKVLSKTIFCFHLTVFSIVAMSTDTIETFTWEALPPRSASDNNVEKDEQPDKRSKGTHEHLPKPRGVAADKFENISKSIAVRSTQHQAPGVTSLESKDGCAGEFFECKKMCVKCASLSSVQVLKYTLTIEVRTNMFMLKQI